MDLTSILPLLMGNKNPEMAKILSAMNNGGAAGGGTNDLLASILASQNKAKGDSGKTAESDKEAGSNNKDDMQAKLLSGLMGGGSQAELLMNLMGSMNKQKSSKPPTGFTAIQKIAPNDILGAMLKYYSRKKA